MVDTHGRFVWYELLTTHMRSQAFYAKVVGWGTQDALGAGTRFLLSTRCRSAG